MDEIAPEYDVVVLGTGLNPATLAGCSSLIFSQASQNVCSRGVCAS